jgi:lysozyme
MRFVVPALGLALIATVLACSSSSDNTCSSTSSALSVCAKGAVVKGVDVSVYQGLVDWNKAKGAGVLFAIARVSDGTGNPDTQFANNWPGMKKAGVLRGTYQFFRPSEDPIAQADLMFTMLNKAGGLQSDDLPPVMDIEVTDNLAPAAIQAAMKKWLNYVEGKINRKPIIYTAAFMSANVGSGFSAYPLWVANYGPVCPTMPSGWNQWEMWQYSDKSSYAGINGGVDGDEFNGTLQDLIDFAKGPKPPAPDGGVPTSDAGSGTKDASAPAVDASTPNPNNGADASVNTPPNPCGP